MLRTKMTAEKTMHMQAALERRVSPSSVNTLSKLRSMPGLGFTVSGDFFDIVKRPSRRKMKNGNEFKGKKNCLHHVDCLSCKVDISEGKKLPRVRIELTTFRL
ncbi:hypothetical protein QR680_008530 [Steinernema hermaphroditum]|uniref:Uncharacterized protein n=1 Tax=Steinernema hermaphroditum TaxID=289476 RepID=A0AA39IJE1_9BILA|nr:hypothetical protein QR680_008530 [Steinernema hermaphroditum]